MNKLSSQQKALTTYEHPVSTLLNPNIKGIINAFGCFLHERIQEDRNAYYEINPNGLLDYFNEEKYCRENPEKFKDSVKEILFIEPTVQEICDFIELLQNCGKFRSECLIISLIYIIRFRSLTGMPLLVSSWRPLLICSFMIAQKIWEEKHLSNAYFAFIHPFLNVAQIDKLEKIFLELIEYNVTIKMSLYVKYYFELRSKFQNEFDFAYDEAQLKTFESKSSKYKEELIKTAKKISLTHCVTVCVFLVVN